MNDQNLPTVLIDFNNRAGRHYSLSCYGTIEDLKKLGVVLRQGLRLRVTDNDEFVAVGIVEWSPEFQDWSILIEDKDIVEIATGRSYLGSDADDSV